MIAIIGDIHGCFYTLKEVYKKTKEKYPNIDVYCVGDLVDRGNFSHEVVDFIIEKGIKFTPGNHDYMFYFYMQDPQSFWGRTWLYNGPEKTLESYDKIEEKLQTHLKVIKDAPLFFNLDDCFVSHAGISLHYKEMIDGDFDKNIESAKSILYDDIAEEFGILWTRDPLLNIGKLQVVGHTRLEKINYLEKNNVVYIDTSVYTGNKLSCIVVNNNKISDIISVPTVIEDIG